MKRSKRLAVRDSADIDKEWSSMRSKLWNGEKVTKPDHWTDEDWTDFVIAIEDFELSDDNPEGTVLKEDGYTAWFETPGLETIDEDYYEGVTDSYEVGEFYDDGDVKGKIEQIITAEDGTRSVVVETTNDDGDVESVEVAIEDSSGRDKFLMNLLLKKKATCPVTGVWEIKGSSIYNKGKKVASLAKDVETTIKNIERAMDKISDGKRQFTQYSDIDDKNIDELFDKGETNIPIRDLSAEELFEEFDEIVQSYAGPDGYIDLAWEEDPYGKWLHVRVVPETTYLS